MVNEERLQHMIKISRFDTYDGKECKPMTQYARTDYVSLELLKSFVTGTVTFFLMLGLWGLYSMERLMEEINKIDIQGFLISLLVLYLAWMLAYLCATYLVFNIKYTKGRRKVKKYYSSLKKINQMYEREGRLKRPGNKDWE